MKLFKAKIECLRKDLLQITKFCHLDDEGSFCNSHCAQADVKLDSYRYKDARTNEVTNDESCQVLVFTCKATGQQHSFPYSEMMDDHKAIINTLIGENNNEHV